MPRMKKQKATKAECKVRESNGYEIYNDVEAPPRTRRSAYPWASMVVGEAFFVEGKTMKQTSGIYGSARRAGVKVQCWGGKGKGGAEGLWVKRVA